MHLIYFDESGNSGTNLADPQQPVFVLGALIVHETLWQAVESDLEAELSKHIVGPRPPRFEVHAGDIRQGTAQFKGVSVQQRLALRDGWMAVAIKHRLPFIYRAITKSRYDRWMRSAFGNNISVNPHLAAFALVAQVANNYLRAASKDALGIIISDDVGGGLKVVEKWRFENPDDWSRRGAEATKRRFKLPAGLSSGSWPPR
jgi:hypothetical protein